MYIVFIERQQYPTIEFDPTSGQHEPTIAHYLSNQAEPLRAALPVLAERGDEERVLVLSAPLSALADEAIRLHRHPEFAELVVIDEKHRPYFAAVRSSLAQALAKIDAIQFAPIDDQEEEDA